MLKQNSTKLLITGGNGYIAQSLYAYFKDKYEVTTISKDILDLTDRQSVSQYFVDKYYDVIIHTAAKGVDKEDTDVLAANLRMHDNLIRCRSSFDRMIYFGSSAQDAAETPYGFGKHIINQLTRQDSKIINVKIYAVFDENELNSRFIKSNISRYIRKENMVIHKDRKMDFFYMKDLISLVDWLIINEREGFHTDAISCGYDEKYTLSDIARLINTMAAYRVDIEINNPGLDKPYYDTYQPMPMPLVGLEQGIRYTYKALKYKLG